MHSERFVIVSSGILGVSMCIPLCIQILCGKVKQNLAAWALWAIITSITTGTLIVQRGNYLLPLAYTVGNILVALSILKSRNVSWTWFESLVVSLVLLCIVIWIILGAKVATVIITIASFIAGMPQLFDTYRRPQSTPVLIFLGYFVASSMSLFGGKEWSIRERCYSLESSVYCLLLALLASRKFWSKHKGP